MARENHHADLALLRLAHYGIPSPETKNIRVWQRWYREILDKYQILQQQVEDIVSSPVPQLLSGPFDLVLLHFINQADSKTLNVWMRRHRAIGTMRTVSGLGTTYTALGRIRRFGDLGTPGRIRTGHRHIKRRRFIRSRKPISLRSVATRRRKVPTSPGQARGRLLAISKREWTTWRRNWMR